MNDPANRIPHLLVIGGGFAGLWATRALARAPLRITLLDRSNHHLFQPLLYQVATAGLSAPDIAAPLRHILRRQRNVTVLLGEVTGIARVIGEGIVRVTEELAAAAGERADDRQAAAHGLERREREGLLPFGGEKQRIMAAVNLGHLLRRGAVP